jgi:hypothetical protein
MKAKFTFIGSITIILLSIFCIHSNAQHINYSYDANGNRILRQYSPTRLMGDTSKSDSEAHQIATQYGIGVYPNPLMDGNNVTVVISSLSDKPEEEAIVYALDNTGKVLFSQKQNTASPSQSDSYRMDLNGYSAGIYYIKVAIGKEVLFYKITKAK